MDAVLIEQNGLKIVVPSTLQPVDGKHVDFPLELKENGCSIDTTKLDADTIYVCPLKLFAFAIRATNTIEEGLPMFPVKIKQVKN